MRRLVSNIAIQAPQNPTVRLGKLMDLDFLVILSNVFLDWPPNGTSYSFPGDSYYPSDTLFDIRSNILIFYR